jgi:adenosine deaminase CECR1
LIRLMKGFVCAGLISLSLSSAAFASNEMSNWFEQLKSSGEPEEIYKVLMAMPKGGDLHMHGSGSVFSEWWYELALEQEQNGYRYYTKTKINNCRAYGGDEYATPYLMYFHTIQESSWNALGECEQAEYTTLADLDEAEKQAWMDSVRLDKAHEGRNEFFERHWQRLGDMTANPYLAIEALVRNIKAFSDEGMIYMEPDFSVFSSIRADGSRFPPNKVAEIVRNRLAAKDVTSTGMTVRLQLAILRFLPGATEHLKVMYKFVSENNDLWVAVDMVGREDNGKGYPKRFLETLRELRRAHHGVRLSIHGGEVDEPNRHVRDTLHLGAERIGHGVNLISDPDLMLLMRGGPYLVEINLVSNLMLDYVDDYSGHPFPEYLRLGIPVALSTDDRGMWDSVMTDEFFVAVREFNLSWDEIKTLSRNSLKFSFVQEDTKQALLKTYDKRISAFEKRMLRGGIKGLQKKEIRCRGFLQKQYQLCE